MLEVHVDRECTDAEAQLEADADQLVGVRIEDACDTADDDLPGRAN